MTKKWWGIWIAAIVVSNALAWLAHAQEKAPPTERSAAGAQQPTAASAAPGATTDAEVVEEVATVEEVTPVAVSTSTGSTGALGKLGNLVGKLHPLLVHFPIAWIVLLVLVDLATYVLRRPWQTFGLLVGVGAALASIPTAATGFLRMASMDARGEMLELLIEHRNLALVASTLVLAAVILRSAKRNVLTGGMRAVYVCLVVIAAALIAFSAHHGALAVHGKDYFSLGS